MRYPKDVILFPERVLLRLAPGTLQRMADNLEPGEIRAEVIRQMIEDWNAKREEKREIKYRRQFVRQLERTG